MKRYALTIAIFLTVFIFPTYASAQVKEPPFRKTQFFCGYCHILTYPKVIEKAHASWKAGKHKDIPCAQCHYPPEKYGIKIRQHRKIPRDKWAASKKRTELQLMKTELEVVSRLMTILKMEDSAVLRRAKIDDRSCTTSKCHPKTGKGKKGKYWVKKIKVAEYKRDDKSKAIVSLVHKEHYKKEKWVTGDIMQCATCHQRETKNKHFEVSKASCFLCHFGNNKFNEGLAKCALCHKVPEKPLQKQKSEEEKKKDEKPITHKSMEEAKVPCWSCHREVIKGTGKVSREKCLNCHDGEKRLMKTAEKQELMHKEHVAAKNARCFECHEPIEHKKVADYIKPSIEVCSECHQNTHIYQVKLLRGDISQKVENTPSLMHDVKTNCLGCHIQFEHDGRGQKVKRAPAKACVDCHTKRHKEMLQEWKDKVKEELESAQEIEKEALEALGRAKGKVSKEKLQQAMALLKEGQESMQYVVYGGGVHNKKYSIMLLDVAMNNFEDLIDLLKEE